MDIRESIEVRWFLPADDARAARLVSWFSRAFSEAPRHDRYRRLRRADLGIKKRGGRPKGLEVKFRVCAFGSIHLSPTVLGEVERWTKLTVSSTDADDSGWTTLTKERRVRVFGLVGGCAVEVMDGAHPGAGCAVELTRVAVAEGEGAAAPAAWSLGLEAFGPPEILLEALYAVGRAVFVEVPDLGLTSVESKGYPAWLAEGSAER
ncbi:hypothetical protein WMF39_39600 [Sorangium sp. So ce1504]|uniref:hypothetical protein n=1 Tax=Sorangium sp. So ce1504 TaxID=3133337 RepID=UPI003F5D81EA